MRLLISVLTAFSITSNLSVGAADTSGSNKPNSASKILESYRLSSPSTLSNYSTKVLVGKSLQSRAVGAGTLSDAWEEMKKGQFKRAISILNKVIEANKTAEALALRANCWYVLNSFDQAMADADQSIAADRQQVLPWLIKGHCHMQGNDAISAISSFSEAIKLDPENVDARQSRGACYLFHRQLDAAIADEDVAIKNDPNNYDAYWVRAQANSTLGDWPKVKTDGESMVKIEPNLPEGHLSMGFGLENTGSGYESVAAYQKASACYRAFDRPEQAAFVMQRMEVLIPMFDYGASRTPVQQ